MFVFEFEPVTFDVCFGLFGLENALSVIVAPSDVTSSRVMILI